MNSEYLVSIDGFPLLYRRWPRRAAPHINGMRKTVFLGHSQPTHSGLLDEFGRAFNSAGWDAASGDVRGHGGSTDGRYRIGHLLAKGGWQRAVDDMHKFFGHCFEGVAWENRLIVVPNITALMTLEVLKTWSDVAKHIVLISPPPNQRSIALFGRTYSQIQIRLGNGDQPDQQSLDHLYAFLGAHLKDRRHPADVLSTDRSVVDKVVSDPLAWPIPTPAYWYNIFSGILSAWKWPRGVKVKPGTRVLIMYGSDDAMTRDGGFLPPMERVLKQAGIDDISSACIEGGRTALFLDEKRLKIADHILCWVGHQWLPEGVQEELSLSDVATKLFPDTILKNPTRELNRDELIDLCYEAIGDENRWTELMYRLMAEAEGHEETADEILEARLKALMPHWNRSFEFHKQSMMNAALSFLIESVVDRLGIGIAILDADDQWLHSNQAYLDALDRLFPIDDNPRSNESFASRKTRELLADDKSSTAPDGTGKERVVLHQNVPVGFHCQPEALMKSGMSRHGPATVLILRTSSDLEVEQDSRIALTEFAYGLTRKEAEIALLVSAGHSPAEIAELLNILVSTVRAHLKSAFSKMHVHSQSELTARILSGPVGWLK